MDVMFKYKNRFYTIPERSLANPRVRMAIATKRVHVVKGLAAVKRAGIVMGGQQPAPRRLLRRRPKRPKRPKHIVARRPRIVVPSPRISVSVGRPSGAFRKPRRRFFGRKSLTGLEMMHLKNIAKKHGVEKDLFDWKAHIDSSLGYHENKTQIEKKILAIAPMKVEPELFSKKDFNAQYQDEFRSHINGLRFLAETGDKEAKSELEAIRKMGRGIKI